EAEAGQEITIEFKDYCINGCKYEDKSMNTLFLEEGFQAHLETEEEKAAKEEV
ncbi:11370_t:CDS:1, partial [Scutellospora calospora]